MSEKSYRGLPCTLTNSTARKDHRAVDLISDALPFGRVTDFYCRCSRLRLSTVRPQRER